MCKFLPFFFCCGEKKKKTSKCYCSILWVTGRTTVLGMSEWGQELGGFSPPAAYSGWEGTASGVLQLWEGIFGLFVCKFGLSKLRFHVPALLLALWCSRVSQSHHCALKKTPWSIWRCFWISFSLKSISSGSGEDTVRRCWRGLVEICWWPVSSWSSGWGGDAPVLPNREISSS